jgi:hypothetical protein
VGCFDPTSLSHPPAIQRWVSAQMKPGLFPSADETRGSGQGSFRRENRSILLDPGMRVVSSHLPEDAGILFALEY